MGAEPTAAAVVVEYLIQQKPTILQVAEIAAGYKIHHLWTDASTDGGPNGKPMLEGIPIGSKGQARAFSRVLQPHELAAQEGEKRIKALEVLGTRLATEVWGDRIEKPAVFANVDNMTQLFALVKLSSINRKRPLTRQTPQRERCGRWRQHRGTDTKTQRGISRTTPRDTNSGHGRGHY